MGTSDNTVENQICTALIGMLLLRYLHLRSRFGWCLSNVVVLMNLLTTTVCKPECLRVGAQVMDRQWGTRCLVGGQYCSICSRDN